MIVYPRRFVSANFFSKFVNFKKYIDNEHFEFYIKNYLANDLISENSKFMPAILSFAESVYSELSEDYKFKMVELFKAGRITEARKLVCGQVRPDEIDEIYRWLYDNIAMFGDDARQEKAIVIIKQGLVDHTLVMDPEINLAATLIKLSTV